MQLRDSKPGLSFPGHWSTLGGRIEGNETPEAAMRRELIEEIELCPPIQFWRVFDHRYWQRNREFEVQVFAFVGELDISAESIHLHEGELVAWLGASDIDRLPFAFGLDALFREYFQNHEHRNHTGGDFSSPR